MDDDELAARTAQLAADITTNAKEIIKEDIEKNPAIPILNSTGTKRLKSAENESDRANENAKSAESRASDLKKPYQQRALQ